MKKQWISLVLLLCFGWAQEPLPTYVPDDAATLSLETRDPNSHLHVYIPSLPYAYIMRLVNGTLVRLNDSPQGWEYFLAYKHQKIDALTYDFWLRKDVKFQDGTPLDADSVVDNFRHFQKGAFTYTHIHRKLKSVEKIGPYRVRIHLTAPYGMLFHDLARINLYTPEYYRRHQWTKSITAENTAIPGPYGAGPYILAKGFATGLSQSDTVVLRANPYYFEEGKPYVQTITVHTRMPANEVVENLANTEGNIDIAFIPLNKKTEIVNSSYAKLITIPSTTVLSVLMNLMNPDTPLQDIRIRRALNQVLDQEKLLTFAYKNEGVVSPFPISANMPSAQAISKRYTQNPPHYFSTQEAKALLEGLHLKVITQDRFMPIWKGIQYQLSHYGVTLEFDITSDEKYVFSKLLTNRAMGHDWDLLMWGNEDWYGHPFTSFIALYTPNQWCAIDTDSVLDTMMEELFMLEKKDAQFIPLVEKILMHIYDQAYTLNIPSPNMVLGVNKEVDFTPSSVAIMPLWEAKVTPHHWSVRGKTPLPKERLKYRLPQKIAPHE